MITAAQTSRTALTSKCRRVLLKIGGDITVTVDFRNQRIEVNVPTDVPYEITDPDDPKEAACRPTKPN